MIIEINFWVWGLRLGLGLRFGIQIKDWEFGFALGDWLFVNGNWTLWIEVGV